MLITSASTPSFQILNHYRFSIASVSRKLACHSPQGSTLPVSAYIQICLVLYQQGIILYIILCKSIYLSFSPSHATLARDLSAVPC